MRTPKNVEISIASVPNREQLVAEIWCDDEMWVEISEDTGEPLVRMYPRRSGEPWILPFDEVPGLLHEALSELRGHSDAQDGGAPDGESASGGADR